MNFQSTLATLILVPVFVVGGVGAAKAGRQKDKKPAVPTLPSGPTGPLPQIPLDFEPTLPPAVVYRNGELTIDAPNSTLSDILRGVRDETGTDIEMPAENDRVTTHLGPAPLRKVVADLLKGSRYNYILLGLPSNPKGLSRIVLVPKTGVDLRVASPTERPVARQEEQVASQPEPPTTQEIIEPPPPSEGSVELTADQL